MEAQNKNQAALSSTDVSAILPRITGIFKSKDTLKNSLDAAVQLLKEVTPGYNVLLVSFEDGSLYGPTAKRFSSIILEKNASTPPTFQEQLLDLLEDEGVFSFQEPQQTGPPFIHDAIIALQIKALTGIPIAAANNICGAILLMAKGQHKLWSRKELEELVCVGAVIGQYLRSQSLERKLAKTNEHLQIAIESSNEGFWYINLKENTIYFSEPWKKMLGYEPEDLSNSFSTLEEIIHPADQQGFFRMLEPYRRKSSDVLEYECRMKRKDGSYNWILVQSFVKFDAHRQPVSLVGRNFDITARINYQRDIEQKEEEYSAILNGLQEVVFQADSSGRLTFLNPAWSKVTGFTLEQAYNTKIWNYIISQDRWKFISPVQQDNNSSGDYFDFETQLITAKGDLVWVVFYCKLIRNAELRVTSINGTIININQRKQAELAQRESEEKFKLMSENISDLICLHNVDGVFYYISPSVRKMLHFEPRDLLGKPLYEFVHPDDEHEVKQHLHLPLVRRLKEQSVSTLRMLTQSGEYIWVETITQAIVQNGELQAILSVSRDITERREAEIETEKALQKERELNELKSRFITMASHEFRTPLTSIKSSVEMIEMYSSEADKKMAKLLGKHVQRMNGQIDRLADLMNNILVVGKTEADKMPFEPEEVDFAEVLNEWIEQDYSPWRDERSLVFELSGSHRTTKIDVNLMRHIINNMLSNAFKYSKGKPAPILRLNYGPDHFVLEAQDFGIGIPKEEQDQLFQSFFRAQNTLEVEGTGLGLMIMKQFVELHGGHVEVESEENVGTTIRVTIPYA